MMFYDHDLEHKQVSVACGDCQAAGKLMSRDAWRLGFAAADARVGNIDGGPWIINQIQIRKLPMTRATAFDPQAARTLTRLLPFLSAHAT